MALAKLKKSLAIQNGFSDSATKIIITVATGIIHQVMTSVTFHCPCVNPTNLRSDCPGFDTSNHSAILKLWPTNQCLQMQNLIYGWVFVARPAVALFFLGLAFQTALWKLITGFCKMSGHCWKKCLAIRESIVEIIFKACISPLVWICFSLFDGRHLACAYTPLPYDVGGSNSIYADCQQASQSKAPAFSVAYLNTQAFFQLVGCVILATLSIFYFMVLCICKCCEPRTYYQAEYARIYKSTESIVFTKKMREKALAEAEKHVNEFFQSERKKKDWDRVIYDDETLNRSWNNRYYSPLQKYMSHSDEEQEMLEENSV